MQIVVISDSTGDTALAVMKASVAQFSDLDPQFHVYSFVRSANDLAALDESLLRDAALIGYTSTSTEIRSGIADLCHRTGTAAVAILDPVIEQLSNLLSQEPDSRPGQQYQVDAGYLDRIAAIDFAISQDDGMSTDRLAGADIILLGVSRTSKTPTCIFLAYQGIKAANIPVVPGKDIDGLIKSATTQGIPILGLTASPSRLQQVRNTRLKALGSSPLENYTDLRQIEEELIAARLLFDRFDIPVVDVTRRSIEETAASVRRFLASGKSK